jgi:hypothetical protein
MALDNEALYAGFMYISPDKTETTGSGAHCWVTIQQGHEPAFRALLNTVTAGGQFSYTPVGEFHLYGLSDGQQAELIMGREDLIYRDRHGSIFVLEDLWSEVEVAAKQIAPHATIQHQTAVNLSFADQDMVDKLRTELSVHPALNYLVIEFGED